MAQRVIQNDQAIQMHSLQVQEHQCQLGILQAQNQFHPAWDYLSICQFDACRKSNRLDTWLTFDLSQFFGTNSRHQLHLL